VPSRGDAAVAELLALRQTLADTRQRADACTDEQPGTVCAIIEDQTDSPAS
jgi:hypothetical protein